MPIHASRRLSSRCVTIESSMRGGVRSRWAALSWAALIAAGIACTGIATAAETAALANPAGIPGDELSYTLDVDGTRIATGSPGEASATGATYVFDCASLPCAAPVRVAPNDLAAGDRFGAALALSGDTLVVGAPGQSPGAVYVFIRSGSAWVQQARVVASGSASSDGFGRALALDGDRLVAAAAAADNRAGAAYVFARAGTVWLQQARLVASDAAADDGFGRSVAISGDTILAGAPLKPSAAGHFANGAVYAFVRSGALWPQQAKLVAQASVDGDSFGSALAMDGERAIVGAPLAANRTGGAYVFERAGTVWTQQALLVNAAGVDGDSFGWAVALSGNLAIVGAPYALNTCGATYGFAQGISGWAQTANATIGSSVRGDLAGWSVAADQGRWVVAAPGHDGPLRHVGVAYWFDAVDRVFADGFDASGTSDCVAARRLRSGP
jgi:hypothetical protein